MKELTRKKDDDFGNKTYLPLSKQSYNLAEVVKGIFMSLLYIFIFVFCYYIYMHICNFNNDNYELITICSTNCAELEPVVNTQPNIWYRYILDDFFNKFTSNSKTINCKVIEIKSDCTIRTLMPLKHNFDTEIAKTQPVILNKIQSDSMKSIISECEFHKNKTSLLEIQLLNTKIAYHNLIKDINDIIKEMNSSS